MLITGKEAQLILGITTRQGLHKLVHKHNIEFKGQGNGKPNLYKKEDIEKLKEIIGPPKQKAEIKKKILKREKIIENNKKNIEKVKTETKKELKLIEEDKPVDNLFDDEDIIKPPFNPNEFEMKDLLNEIGQDEFDRVVELLKENGTYKEQDRALVLTYAVSFQNWVFATVASAKQDNTTSDQFGNLKLHPYFTVAEKCATQMSKNASMLGIGVRSRIGVEVAKPKKETFADILNAKEEWK